MKKNLFKTLLLTLLLCFPLVSLNAIKADVKNMLAVQEKGHITVSGEVEKGVYAVQIAIAQGENMLLFKSVEVNSDNTYSLDYEVAEGEYLVQVANYDGGTTYTSYVYPSSVTEKVDINPVDTKADEDKSAAKEVSALVTKLVAGDEVEEGISEELQTKLITAVNNGSDIKVAVETKEVTEEQIAEDAQKVVAVIDKEGKVVKYLDIKIPVTIDGNVEGYVTKLDNPIEIVIDKPDLPEVKEGYTRVFTVVKVHDGVATPLDTKIDANGNIIVKSNEFSTYALTYVDVKNPDSPNTGDNLMTYVTLFALSGLMLGVGAFLISKRKLKK